jgi:hypothetical protein
MWVVVGGGIHNRKERTDGTGKCVYNRKRFNEASD